MREYLLALFTGLTAGGISCLALQGGMLAGLIAARGGEDAGGKKLGALVAAFLAARIAVHAVFGALLGALGSVIALSFGAKIFFQTLAAVFIFAAAMNLLGAGRFFGRLSLPMPAPVRRAVKNMGRLHGGGAFAVLGLATVLVPCGVTQSMELAAIGTGSAMRGAMLMFAFIAGTTPLFALLALFAARFKDAWKERLNKAAAVLLIIVALFSLNGVLEATGAPVSFGRISSYFAELGRENADTVPEAAGDFREITIDIKNNGYSPREITVRAGVPVRLILRTNNTYSCAAAFMLPEYGITANMNPTEERVFEFTPRRKGIYSYTCSMGMYTGRLRVI